MFDEQIAGIVTAILREEQAELHPLTAEHALRAATGTGLVARLPAFPEAPMDTILEARSELAEPLVRYRKGVIDLSVKLMSGPLEPALKAEVNDLRRDEVQPTLVSLRRDLSVTRLAKDAAFNLATDAKALVSGAAGVGVFFGVGWGFHLRRTPEGRTWLVVRNRSRSGPKAIAHPFALLLGEPTHFAMQTRQFHNLRKRLPAEAGSGDSTTAHAPEAYPSPQRRHASAMGPESAMRCTASRVRQPSVCRQRSGIVTVAVTLGLPGLPADAGSRACRRPSGVR
jgi:hypothetical protein